MVFEVLMLISLDLVFAQSWSKKHFPFSSMQQCIKTHVARQSAENKSVNA